MIKKIMLGRRFYFWSLIVSIFVGLGVAWLMFSNAHKSYWLAIERVQTVDFNIVSSSAIGTISGAIQNDKYVKLDEIVTSNNCLFRMAIRKCRQSHCDESELIADNSRISGSCQAKASADKPSVSVPIYKEISSLKSVYFPNSYQDHYMTVNSHVGTDVIGYLDLYRGNPPSAYEDVTKFISRWVDGKANASRYYMYKSSAYFGLLFSVIVFLLLTTMRFYYLSKITLNLIESTTKKINGEI